MDVSQLLKSATQQLLKLTDSPRLDAEVLLAHCLQKNRTWLVTWPDKELSAADIAQFNALLLRRITGEPIAHITGTREFWSLPLTVTADTLIPRPDTELMIEKILEVYPADADISLVDLGTGSGAIALALAYERPNWKITATDQSTAALAIAKHNADNLNLRNVSFKLGSWFEPLGNEVFDVIASNPPYIAQTDPHLTQGDTRFDPITALASGADGLDDIRLITSQARKHLKPLGRLFIEHGYDQKPEMLDIFSKNGLTEIQQANDMANNPRITFAINP